MTYLRAANAADSENLLSWRNDPLTLACFRSTAPVTPEDHERWMKFNVHQGYPEHMVMIAESEDYGSIGVVRFDAVKGDLMSYNASITIDPSQRGKGYGHFILQQACGFMQEYGINAEIRRDNHRSRKIFTNCGFELIKDHGDFVTYRKEPLT